MGYDANRGIPLGVNSNNSNETLIKSVVLGEVIYSTSTCGFTKGENTILGTNSLIKKSIVTPVMR